MLPAAPPPTTAPQSESISYVGKLVTLYGFSGSSFELNGLNGRVVSWDEASGDPSGYCAVQIDGRGETLAVQPANLQRTTDTPDMPSVGTASSALATAAVASQSEALPARPLLRKAGPLRLQQIRRDSALAEDFEDIEDLVDGQEKATVSLLHRVACERGYEQYVDPATGYSVFTALQLKTRPCCGHGCRHCPYGHVNVPKNGKR
eukprot:jgi/Chrpa1/8768/Chrysochromulina_OHIO_Genome00010955-RA